MKVVFLHTDFRIYWPARLHALRTFLKNKNIDLQVIEIAGQGSPYHFAGSSKRPAWWSCLFPESEMEKLDLKHVRRVVNAKLNKLRPDVVFAGAIAFPSGANAVYWAIRNKKKVVIFDNARQEDVPRSVIVNWVKKQIYSVVDAVFCPAPAWGKTFEHFGFDKSQIFYGVNVVDNDFWQTKMDVGLGFELPDSYMLAVGRQIPKKNFLTLLQAYHSYLERSKEPIHLVFIGEGDQRTKLEMYVNDFGLKQVVFIPFQTQQALRHIYHKASFFVLPSLYGETWGLVVNESMACGLPVLVSNQVGCASTLVAHGDNGYIFDPDNQEDLAQKIELITDLTHQERTAMGITSEVIISQWGLERFCSGAYDALEYVKKSKKKKPKLITKLILRYWHGRYRPV
jgi:glycosyltransferase involved in cell wall biosynthesis